MAEADPKLAVAIPAKLPRLEDVLENTSDCVVLLDHDWRFTYLNSNAAQAISRGRDLVGIPLHEVFAGERGTPEWKLTQKAARERSGINFEFYATALRVWFEVSVHPIPSGLQIFFRDVTERKAAREALSASEETLRLALEAAGDAAWDWNLATGDFRVSGHLVGHMGYGAAPYQGGIGQFTKIIHRDDLLKVRMSLVDHLTGRSDSYRCEYRLRTKDGQWRWNLDRGRVVARDPVTKRALRLVGTSSDITELKIAEEISRDQANLLRLAQEGAAAGAWSFDLRSGVTTLSPRAIEVLGLPQPHPGKLGAAAWAKIIYPDDYAEAERVLTQARQSGCAYFNEYRVRRADGSIIWVQSVGNIVSNEEGGFDRLIGLLFDVTERRVATRALEESEERLRLTLEATGDGAWDWDLASNKVARSPRLMQKLGYADIDMDGSAMVQLVHPDDRASVKAALRNHLTGRSEAFSVEYRMRSEAGQWFWIHDRGRAVARDEAGRVTRLVGTSTDVSQRKLAELELQRVQGELIHLSRLSAMGAMASTLAHELNQPLTSIANYARGLRRAFVEPLAPGLLDEAVDGVEASAERAGEIVRRLRDYVTKGEVTRRPEPLGELVAAAAALAFVDAPSAKVSTRISIPEELPPVWADRVQIQQVLLNLMRNALEAVREKQGDRLVEVTARRISRSRIEVRVADTGIGVPAEMLDQLFTPFVTTKPNGMGVGLSISRTIVESHDGQIRVEPLPEGTAFCFTLPLMQS